MKTLRFFAVALVSIMLSVGYTSCDDEPDSIKPNLNNGSNSGENGSENDYGGYTDARIKSLIKEHVSVEGSYHNYAWSFHIESTLHNELPGRTIKFGVGHGDINGITIVSWENQAYKYTSNYRNGMFTADITNPFFFYYYFGKGKNLSQSDDAVECEFYYRSYATIMEKGFSNLSSEERDFLNSLVDIFEEYEPAAKNDYKPSIWVGIDNKGYVIKEF